MSRSWVGWTIGEENVWPCDDGGEDAAAMDLACVVHFTTTEGVYVRSVSAQNDRSDEPSYVT